MEGELSDVLLVMPLSESEIDEDELDRGAETGMTTPVFFKPDRENFGAEIPGEKSISGASGADRAEGVAGFESAHNPEGDFFICGRRFSGEIGGEGGGERTADSLGG